MILVTLQALTKSYTYIIHTGKEDRIMGIEIVLVPALLKMVAGIVIGACILVALVFANW